MCFPPVAWRHPFPIAESTSERVGIFKTQQVGCFVQFQSGVAEVVPRHLMTCFVQDSLEARSQILQATLQGTRSHMKGLRNRVDRGAMSSEFVLDGPANQLQKAVLFFVLTQLLQSMHPIMPATIAPAPPARLTIRGET